jgi:DnaJ-class molecular chaperone
MASESNLRCSRCGGSGKVTRGAVINGVCFKCGGDGKHRPSVHSNRRYTKVVQWVAVDAKGNHIALNTDRETLEKIASTISGFDHIEEYVR